jgi:hypothetical protein
MGFITLASIAVGGLIFFALSMPETKPEEGIGSSPSFATGAIDEPPRLINTSRYQKVFTTSGSETRGVRASGEM